MIKQFVWLCVLSSALAYRITDDCIEDDIYATLNCNIYHPCLPGWICPGEEANKCQIDEASCLKYYESNVYRKARWRPNCRKSDGAWGAKQCKGDRCFCYDDNGKRMFGDAFADEASDMTCACSRKQFFSEEGNKWSHLLFFADRYCDDMGNYEPLQCARARCFCVEPNTGKIIDKLVFENQMKSLPCYNETVVRKPHFHECVEKARDIASRVPGSTVSNLLECLYRAPIVSTKIENGIVYCVWRNNTIGGYSANLTDTDVADIDCNCARDTKLYEEVGRPLLRTCLPNGNYNPVQRDGNYYYCVDRDGFRISIKEREELTPEDCTKVEYEVCKK